MNFALLSFHICRHGPDHSPSGRRKPSFDKRRRAAHNHGVQPATTRHAMPELPEVETVCRGLAPALEGRRLERVILRRPDLRFPLPNGFGQRLTGCQVKRVGRRAKFLLIEFEDDTVLVAHLGMSGRFRVFAGEPPPEEPHDHVILEASGGLTVRFNDPRRFGFMDLTTNAELAMHPMLAKLGPEPVYPGLDGPALAARLKGRGTTIKAALLDQAVIAGIGNIYASETLHEASISPRRVARSVQGARAAKLAAAVRDVLERAIEAGGSSLRNHRQPTGELGYFQHEFRVYGREGELCPRCGEAAAVRRISQSGRSTFYCSGCQR